ncbi:MAG: exo-alpha-sialidase [Candidatus Latescibacteria bacterium]|nr:exo-alpha-sialidase [Candidatus Latescibacterota bacterium]
MHFIRLNTTLTGNERNWTFIGAPQWKQNQEGVIYPPIWSNPRFLPDPTKLPDYYADDLVREDQAFLTTQALEELDVFLEYKIYYGSVVHGGIVFRAQDNASFYVIEIEDISPHREQAYELVLWAQDEHGYRKELARGQAPHAIVPHWYYEKGPETAQEWRDSSPDWIRIRIQATGTYIRASVDGNIVFEHRDRTYAAGYFGLTGRGAFCLRNLQVSGTPAEHAPPFKKLSDAFPRCFFPGGEQPEGGSSYPKVCRTGNGALALAWAFLPLASKVRHSTCVVFTRSDEEGGTWTRPIVLFESGGPRCVPTSLFAHQDGRLSCFVYLFPQDGERPGQTRVVRSGDGGNTWGKPEDFLAGGRPLTGCEMTYSTPIRLADGAVIMTGVEYQILPGGDSHSIGGRVDRALVFRSTDDGHTWDAPILFNPATFDSTEAVVAEIEPGKLMALMSMKSSHTKCATTSADGGKTWTPMSPINLSGYCSDLLRHSSGALILAHRAFGTFIVISFDGGLTWTKPWRMSPASAMMSMVEMDDGRIGIFMNEGYRVPGRIRGQFFRVTPDGPVAAD